METVLPASSRFVKLVQIFASSDLILRLLWPISPLPSSQVHIEYSSYSYYNIIQLSRWHLSQWQDSVSEGSVYSDLRWSQLTCPLWNTVWSTYDCGGCWWLQWGKYCLLTSKFPLGITYFILEFGCLRFIPKWISSITNHKCTFQLTFQWTSSISQPTWNIQVMQISCTATWKPQDGCSQWYTGTTGYVKSFNYDNSYHLANQQYTVCVRQELGYCSIGWTAVSTTSFQVRNCRP